MRSVANRALLSSRASGLVCLALAGAAAAACSSGAGGEEIARSADAINGTSCDQVVLTATLTYRPKRAVDGTATLGGSMKFALPGEIPVTAGAPGNHEATLTLTDGDGSIQCTYRGNGTSDEGEGEDEGEAHGHSGHGGTAYVLDSCSQEDLTAGATVHATSFALHLKNGDKKSGNTTARLSIDEARPCDPATRGEVNFNDHTLTGLNGNGRACADCHMASDSFQLSPANVEIRFQAFQAGHPDALFLPLDADDFRTNGASAHDFGNLRQNGLIRITVPLPANVKLIDPATNAASTETVADVWRAVPTINNVKITGPDTANPVWPRGPNTSGGYQLDARVDTLQNQATGAFFAHAQTTVAPAAGFLDDIAAFENTKFSSASMKTVADAMAAGTTPPDSDPALTALEQAGKAVFIRACTQCHGGPNGSSVPVQLPPIRRYHDINSACPRPVDVANPPRFVFPACPPSIARNARTYEITRSTGAIVRMTSTDPGRALLTGFVEAGPPPANDWQKMDIPTLHGIANTAPYFHNNSAADLDTVLDHYDAFFKLTRLANPNAPILVLPGSGPVRPFTAAERPALRAYLNKL
jgi:cytochrome c peroxidase